MWHLSAGSSEGTTPILFYQAVPGCLRQFFLPHPVMLIDNKIGLAYTMTKWDLI